MATSTQKLKVLSVSAADYGGGAEKIAMALFEALRNQGHKSWMAVGQRRHDHPDIFRLPDARWREAALGMLGPMVDSLWGAERVRRKVQQLTSRSEEHTSELQSLMRISYAVFGLKKKTKTQKRK